MSWYEFLLFVHVTAAVVWLGGAFTFQIYGAVVRRGGDPTRSPASPAAPACSASGSSPRLARGHPRRHRADGRRQLGLGRSLGRLRARHVRGLVRDGDVRDRADGEGPARRRARDAGRPGADPRLFTVLRVDLVYMYAIVFAMVVKPTTDDGWTS